MPETSKTATALRKTVAAAMDHAGTLPAAKSVKVRPDDWRRITDQARSAAILIEDLTTALAEARDWMCSVEPQLRDAPNFKRDAGWIDAVLARAKGGG